MSVIANETNLLKGYKNSGISNNLYPKILMKLTKKALSLYSNGLINENQLEMIYTSLPDENDGYSYDGIGLAKQEIENYFNKKQGLKTKQR